MKSTLTGGSGRTSRRALAYYGALLLVCCLVGCRREPKPVTRQWPVMGTFASLTVPVGDADTLADGSDVVAGVFADVNARLSTYLATSEVSQLNAAAGGDPVPISSATYTMLEQALRYGALSEGAFDISVAPLMKLWGFRGGQLPTVLPDALTVAPLLSRVDYRLVELGDGTARLVKPGMAIDLGGIAKGAAVDAGFDALQEAGYHNILVNLGGNMRGGGRPAPDRLWRVGVRHPFDRSKLLGTIALPDGWAVATSGNYEKFVEIEGRRYAHIMDPRTGMPVSGMAGVTVLSRLGVDVDALSTTLFVVGVDEAGAILQRAPDAEALLVPDRHPLEIYITPGFAAHFTPLPLYRDAVRMFTGR